VWQEHNKTAQMKNTGDKVNGCHKVTLDLTPDTKRFLPHLPSVQPGTGTTKPPNTHQHPYFFPVVAITPTTRSQAQPTPLAVTQGQQAGSPCTPTTYPSSRV